MQSVPLATSLINLGPESITFLVCIQLARQREASARNTGGTNDPHWKDYIQFFEYFHGDNGAGLGASHQTGWTGLVAKYVDLFRRLDGPRLLETGRAGAFVRN
jgi:hypothetical protein